MGVKQQTSTKLPGPGNALPGNLGTSRQLSDFVTKQSYISNQEIPRLYRIEQHESLAVSNIPAFHRCAGWIDGIYYLAVSLTMA